MTLKSPTLYAAFLSSARAPAQVKLAEDWHGAEMQPRDTLHLLLQAANKSRKWEESEKERKHSG